MQVAIGNELKIENNKVNAYYNNLFKKLNVAKAWTNAQAGITIYTTQNPIANDKTYSDLELTEYSTVQSCDGLTLTDENRTYDADDDKNSSFKAIPDAASHEIVKVADILRATE